MRPINPKTQELAAVLMRECIRGGCLNAALEASAVCMVALATAVAKDEGIPEKAWALSEGLLEETWLRMEQPNLREVEEPT